MVHALQEIWRVLVPQGYLIDMRPYTVYRPVEVVVGDEVIPVGVIDSSAGESDDIAADKAIAHMVSEGFYTRTQNYSFEFRTYWETVGEFRDYMSKSKLSTILPEVFVEADKWIVHYGADAQLRTRRDILIHRYQRTT